jgi:hypothetical protein
MKHGALLLLLLTTTLTLPSRNYPQTQKNVDENWICPTIMVDCPEADSGRHIKFNANLSAGVPATKVSFKWIVSGGNIIQGQGTEEITVKSKRRKGKTVTATVEVLGIPKICPGKASCSTTLTHR